MGYVRGEMNRNEVCTLLFNSISDLNDIIKEHPKLTERINRVIFSIDDARSEILSLQCEGECDLCPDCGDELDAQAGACPSCDGDARDHEG